MPIADLAMRPARGGDARDVDRPPRWKGSIRRSRGLIRLGGANGATPRDLRLFGSRDQLRRAVELMISWHPERIILAHGRWYETNAVAELRRIFGWVL